MNILYCFTHKVIKAGYKTHLQSHHVNYIKSKSTNSPKWSEIKIINVNNIVKQKSNTFWRFKNLYKVQHQREFSARFDKPDEDYQVLNEISQQINWSIK